MTHHWTHQPPLPDYRNIHRSISQCSWCSSSPNEDYAGNSLLRRDERTGGPTAMEGWNPAVPRSTAEYATGADTQPGMAFIAAGAPPRDINGPPPWPRTIADSGTRREAQIPARRGMDNQGEGHDSGSGDFSPVLNRAANTHPTPGRHSARTSDINCGSARDGGGGPAILNSRFRAAYYRGISSNIQLIQKIDINYYYYVACRRLGTAAGQREWSNLEAL